MAMHIMVANILPFLKQALLCVWVRVCVCACVCACVRVYMCVFALVIACMRTHLYSDRTSIPGISKQVKLSIDVVKENSY